MAQEKDDAGEIYSEINKIEHKIGDLQSELSSLKIRLEKYLVDAEKNTKEEYIADPILEEELTSPITDSFNVVPEKLPSSETITELPKKDNPETVPKSKSSNKPKTEPAIVRPNFKASVPLKTDNAKELELLKSNYQQSKPATPTPDLFYDLKNWIKGKVGNIPLEEFLGINLLNKIGLLLLVVGFSYFLRLAYDWIGPHIKVMGMLLLSVGVFFGGEKLIRDKAYSIFGLGMIASSFALFYFTSYSAFNIEATQIFSADYHLLGFFVLLISSSMVITASLRYKQEALTSFAYFLGFLTISLNDNSEFNFFSLASVAVLAISLIGIMTIMRWRYLTGVGILATYGNYWLYAEGLPRTANGYLQRMSETGYNFYLESILFLLFFWIIFFISTFTMKIEDEKSEKICSAINIMNAFSFFAMLAYIHPEPTEWGSFSLYSGIGVCYLAGAYIARSNGREFLWKSSIVLGLSLITLAIPTRFSEYGNVFGWLLEGTILIILGFLNKEKYIKNLGYLVLIMNLGRFFTLPYGDFYYSSTIAYPLLSFEMNRGMIYISMLFSFFGLIPFLRKQLSSWTIIDKLAYNFLGVLGFLTLILFSFYLVQRPYQAYTIIPSAGILLYFAILFKNRALYYSSASLTVVCLLFSLKLIFQGEAKLHEIHEVMSLLFILLGNGMHYYLGKENLVFKRYLDFQEAHKKSSNSFILKSIFLKGEAFLWVASCSFLGIILNEVSYYLHTISILLASSLLFLLHRKLNQGVKQGVFLFVIAFLVNLFHYGNFQGQLRNGMNSELWIALSNHSVFWLACAGVLFNRQHFEINKKVTKFLFPMLISATTLIGMMIGRILFQDVFILSYSAIYSLALVISFLYIKDDFCIFNSILVSWFSLALGLGVIISSKESPDGIYEYLNLITYTISSLLTTGLIFQFVKGPVSRVLSYLQSILASICFVIIVVPEKYRPIAFAILHLGHLFFLFMFRLEKLYEYSYLTLGISVLSFWNNTDIPKYGKITDYNGIAFIIGYSVLSILQTIFIFLNDSRNRDRYLYFILNSLILFWGVFHIFSLEYGILFFSILVYCNSYLLNKFGIKEIEKLYYYPLGFTIAMFFYRLLSNKPNVIEEMNFESFTIGLVTLFLLLRSVKDAEQYKSKQLDFSQDRIGFDKIVALVLFLEFILLTMTVVDVRWWSLVWTIEAMGFIIYGLFRKQPLIRYAGIGLIGLAVVKVGFWDLKHLQANVRVLVLISIGGLFVTGSFLYAKYKDRLFKEGEEGE